MTTGRRRTRRAARMSTSSRSACNTGSELPISCRRTGATAAVPVSGGGLTMLPSLVIASLAAPALALAQPKPGPHGELYQYQGADRDQRVLAGAKKEGSVVVYTSLNTKDSLPITEVFE